MHVEKSEGRRITTLVTIGRTQYGGARRYVIRLSTSAQTSLSLPDSFPCAHSLFGRTLQTLTASSVDERTPKERPSAAAAVWMVPTLEETSHHLPVLG